MTPRIVWVWKCFKRWHTLFGLGLFAEPAEEPLADGWPGALLPLTWWWWWFGLRNIHMISLLLRLAFFVGKQSTEEAFQTERNVFFVFSVVRFFWFVFLNIITNEILVWQCFFNITNGTRLGFNNSFRLYVLTDRTLNTERNIRLSTAIQENNQYK